jgi:3-hydroxyacyl-CoA dehydrogenase
MTAMATRSFLPKPTLYPDAQPYWDGAREGRLMIKRCLACGQAHHYPRPHCPFCGSASTEWLACSGEATVYSFSIVRAAPRPAAVAVVELPEGPRLTTLVVNADVHALAIGDPVRMTTMPGENGVAVPVFTTARAEAARAYSARALRQVHAVPGLSDDEQGPSIAQVAVVGAGSMGCGIATALLMAELPTLLIDQSEAALERARATVAHHFEALVKRQRLSPEQSQPRLALLSCSTRIEEVAKADLVIEAVWEQMALKQQIFAQLDRHARPGAILASNTSTLDIRQLAQATRRADAVVGLHFFSPAHVMPLLEIVRTAETGAGTLAASRCLGQRLGKVPVVVGVCDGFVGNRLMMARDTEADRLLLEGALPQQVDRVLTEFGLPMGTYELADMAGGIELVYRLNQDRGHSNWLIEQLFTQGRLGQKTGKGFYRYESGKRKPLVDPEVTALIEQASLQAGVKRRRIGDDEVRDRLILPMVNEGAKLLEEGIALRAGDIDVVWQRGFGWPDWKGGPMYHADQMGLPEVVRRLQAMARDHGDRFEPCALLCEMALSAKAFTAP